MFVIVTRRKRQEKQRDRQRYNLKSGLRRLGKYTQAKDDIGEEDIDRILK